MKMKLIILKLFGYRTKVIRFTITGRVALRNEKGFPVEGKFQISNTDFLVKLKLFDKAKEYLSGLMNKDYSVSNIRVVDYSKLDRGLYIRHAIIDDTRIKSLIKYVSDALYKTPEDELLEQQENDKNNS
jgi:hypothetical protein